ncbi:MAG: hypothetical protein IPG59_01200 [Candidatus Melainabacteria bacterium]|nr:MAG: hypothetical protein IPG59_01200 [Candidatus Melainabacteria bacterium]
MDQELDVGELETWAVQDLKFLKIEGTAATEQNMLVDQLFGLQKNNCSIAYLSLSINNQKDFYMGLSLPSKQCPPALVESGIVPRSSFIDAETLSDQMGALLQHVGLCSGIPSLTATSDPSSLASFSSPPAPSSSPALFDATNYGSLILATPISKENLWSEEFNVAEQIRVAKNGLDPEKQPTIQEFVEREQEYFDYVLNTYSSGAWLVCPYFFSASEDGFNTVLKNIQSALEPSLKAAPLKTYMSSELRPFVENFAWLKNKKSGEFINQLLTFEYLTPLSSASLAQIITVLK